MFGQVTVALFQGFYITVKLFALTLLFAFPLGLLISFGSMSKIKIINVPVRLLIWVIRGTPLLLQLITIFYGPGVAFDLHIWESADGRFNAALIAFVINYACYFSEIYRGGIQSIPTGQYEAGKVLGMKKGQIFRKIILLQVIKRILPPMSNEIITLVKDTSLVRIISVTEVIWQAQKYVKNSGLLWPLFYTGVFYLVFSGLLTLLLHYIEKRLDYFK